MIEPSVPRLKVPAVPGKRDTQMSLVWMLQHVVTTADMVDHEAFVLEQS